MDRRGVGELEAEAQVGLVGAETNHGLAKREARKGCADLGPQALLPQRVEQALDGVEHLVLCDEAHLEIDLGVLGLAVGAQVLVAHAARELEVAV